MNSICLITAIALVVLFASVSLFIPYAVVVLGALVALALACGVIRKGRKGECRLGYC